MGATFGHQCMNRELSPNSSQQSLLLPEQGYESLGQGEAETILKFREEAWEGGGRESRALEEIFWGCGLQGGGGLPGEEYKCPTGVPLKLNPLRLAQPPGSGDAHAGEKDTWSAGGQMLWLKCTFASLSHQGRNLSRQGKIWGRMFYLGTKRAPQSHPV